MSGRFSAVRSSGIAGRLWAGLCGRSNAGKVPADGLSLQAVPMCVPADLTLLTPTMRVAVVEDACWALAMHVWRERKPFRWRTAARREWAAERRTLDTKRDRIHALVQAARGEQPQHG